MVDAVLGTDGYYFSTAFDLTHTLQRLANTSPDFKNLPLHERVNFHISKSVCSCLQEFDHLQSRFILFLNTPQENFDNVTPEL